VLVAGEETDEDLGTWRRAAAAAAGGPVDACERGVNEVERNCMGLLVDMGRSFSSFSFLFKVFITYYSSRFVFILVVEHYT
jgi:hypothetical protein